MKTNADISRQRTPAETAYTIRNLIKTTCRQNPFYFFGNFGIKYRFDPRKGDREPVIIVAYSPKTDNKNLTSIVGEVKLTDYRWYQKYSPRRLYQAWKLSGDRTGYFRNLLDYTKAFIMVIRVIVELRHYPAGADNKKQVRVRL